MDEEFNRNAPSTNQWITRRQTLGVVVRRLRPLALIILSVLAGIIIYHVLFPAPIPPSEREIDERIVQAMASATPPPAYSHLVYQIILPSLVFIQVNLESEGEADGGVGSGVIVNESGDILTAYHVVAEATEIQVFFADGS